jgi:hypothetical protein
MVMGDVARLTDDHVKTTCRPGQGAETCRFLTMSAQGWCCEKLSGLAGYLNRRVATNDITAQGDNCEGRIGADGV